MADLPATLGGADQWLRRQAPRALAGINLSSGDAILRSIKAVTEILFWHRYVSPAFATEDTCAVDAALLNSLDWPLCLSIFRHNPELSALFLALASVSRDGQDDAVLRDIIHLGRLFARIPRERTIFRALDHEHGLKTLFSGGWPTATALNLCRSGCLPARESHLVLDENSFYAITHTVFYMTDFGRAAWPETAGKEAI